MSCPPITLDDVKKIIVHSDCEERSPCGHSSKVVLKDGRKVYDISSHDICSLVTHLALEKINPGKEWNAEKVREHFDKYNIPKRGFFAKPPEVVLNKIFIER